MERIHKLNNNFARSLGVSTIILLAGVGVAGCSSAVTNEGSSSQSQEQTKEQTKTDVAASVDGFFAAISEETKKAMTEGTLESADNMSEAEFNALFKSKYPKSFSYMSDEVSESDAVNLIGSFALAYMFAEGEVKIAADEEKIELNGNEARILGENLTLTIDGKEDPNGGSSDSAGSIDLKFVDDKWKFSTFDMGGTEN